MVSLFEPNSTQFVVSAQQQQHDLEKANLFLTITQQLQQLQLALDVGQINEGIISDLHDVLLTTHILLQMGAPALSLYPLEAVRLCRAETFKTIACGYEVLAERDKALPYAQRAAHLYHTLVEYAARTPIDEQFQSFQHLLTEVLNGSLSQVEISSQLLEHLITAGLQMAYALQKWDVMLSWMELNKKGGWQSLWKQSTVQKQVPREQLLAFSLGDVQTQLAADEGILYYYWLDCDQLLLVTVDAEQVLCRRQWFSSADQHLVAEVNQCIGQGLSIAQTHLERLSELLLPLSTLDPVAQAQRAQLHPKRRLLISGHNGLYQIPFQVLRWEEGWLIQHFALTQIPTLSSLLWTYGSANRRPVLTVTTQDPAHPLATPESYPEQVATLYESTGIPTTILTSMENTASISTLELLADIGALQHYSALHFATQGRKTASGAFSLCLQDGELDSLKLMNWALNAELIILEVNTLPEDNSPTIAPNGLYPELHRAFFAAGVRKVVSAASNIPKNISRKIMAGFHAYLSQGEPIDVALQKTLQDSLEEAKLSGEQDAYLSAPYSLFALGRAM